MNTTKIKLSKGVYHLIKNHLKSDQKLSDFNKNKLVTELKSAQVLPAKSIPKHIVSIDTRVQIRDIDTEEEFTFMVVAPEGAKIKNNRLSVLSPIGLAVIGYPVGEEVHWEMFGGLKRYLIEQVSPT